MRELRKDRVGLRLFNGSNSRGEYGVKWASVRGPLRRAPHLKVKSRI
jgi:hypothetical protein